MVTDDLDLWASPILAAALRELRNFRELRPLTLVVPVPVRAVDLPRETRCDTTTLTLPGPIENRCGTTSFITTADAKTVAAQRLSTDGTAFLKSWGGDPSGVASTPPRTAEWSRHRVRENRWETTGFERGARPESVVPQRVSGSDRETGCECAYCLEPCEGCGLEPGVCCEHCQVCSG